MVYGGMVHKETLYIRRDVFFCVGGDGKRDGLLRGFGGEMIHYERWFMGDGTLYRRDGSRKDGTLVEMVYGRMVH